VHTHLSLRPKAPGASHITRHHNDRGHHTHAERGGQLLPLPSIIARLFFVLPRQLISYFKLDSVHSKASYTISIAHGTSRAQRGNITATRKSGAIPTFDIGSRKFRSAELNT
jgi:hypothetical protein